MTTRVLGYLRDHLANPKGFLREKWGIYWAGGNAWPADVVHILKKWPVLKKQGTIMYFQDIGEYESDQLDMQMWLLNPSDEHFKIPAKAATAAAANKGHLENVSENEDDDCEPIIHRNPKAGRMVNQSINMQQPAKL
jgi:hypothetical protein